MERAGWKYWPHPTTGEDEYSTIGALRTYRYTKGYGVAIAVLDPVQVKLSDPNQGYVQSLSSTALAQYWLALYGTSSQPTEATAGGLFEPPPGAHGCQASATHSILDPLPEFNNAVATYVRSFSTTLLSDPRFLAAEKQWSTCMAGNGYQFSTLDQPSEQFQSKRSSLTRSQAAALLPQELATATADVNCFISQVHAVQRSIELNTITMVAERFPQYASLLPSG